MAYGFGINSVVRKLCNFTLMFTQNLRRKLSPYKEPFSAAVDLESETVFAGIFFILPCIESYTKVDLRTVSFDVPPQEVSFNSFFFLHR